MNINITKPMEVYKLTTAKLNRRGKPGKNLRIETAYAPHIIAVNKSIPIPAIEPTPSEIIF